MKRASTLLLVPAAGSGSRLGSPLPKLLTPVAGRPMIEYLFDLYEEVAGRIVFVVPPGLERDVEDRGRARGVPVECRVQPAPTGMLDAILVPLQRVRSLKPDWIWITWCDQVAVRPETVSGLRGLLSSSHRAQLGLPTCWQPDPYIHFDRDGDGRITGVRQRRERDAMPPEGESDAGLFALSFDAYAEFLPRYSREAPLGAVTRERNFLPFVAWLSARHPRATVTLSCRETIESIGINTPEDLRRIEAHLRARPPVVRPRSSS